MIIERVITVEYLEPSMSRELLTKFPDNSAFDFDYSQSGIWSPLLPRNSTTSHTSIPNSNLTQFRRNISPDCSNNGPSRNEPHPCFGFDQRQSGIWSPLLPHRHSTLISVSPMEIRRKLFDGLEERTQSNKRKSKCGGAVKSSAFGFDNSQSGILSPLLPRGQSRPMGSGFPLMMRRKLFDALEKVQQNKVSNVASKIKKKMMIAAVARKQGSSAVDVSVSPDQKVSVNPKKGWGRALKAASRQFKKNRAPSLQIKLPNFMKIGDF